MKHIQIFEDFLFEAVPSDHFENRFELRASSIIFDSGVEDLGEEDLAFVKKRIVEILNKCRMDLIAYDMSWNKGNRDIGYIFNFGDIVLIKNDKYYYPTFKIPKERGSNDYYVGSIFCAICYSDAIITLMCFPRTCKYGSDPIKCKDPLDKEAAYTKFEKDKRYILRKENRPLDPYTILFAKETNFGDADGWKHPKANIIDIPTEESEERKEFERRVRGTVTVKKLAEDKSIIYMKNGDWAKRYIKTYKNINLKNKDFDIEMYLSQVPGGVISTKTYFKRGNLILVEISKTTKVDDDILALRLGYTHYSAEIERYSENIKGEKFFSCRILGPVSIKNI